MSCLLFPFISDIQKDEEYLYPSTRPISVTRNQNKPYYQNVQPTAVSKLFDLLLRMRRTVDQFDQVLREASAVDAAQYVRPQQRADPNNRNPFPVMSPYKK